MKYKGKRIKKILNYILVEELNKGENFRNILSVNENDGKLCMVKEIPKNFFEKEEIKKNIEREMKNLSKLYSKENITCIKDYQRTQNNIYIITEYCNGGNLKDLQNYYINEKKSFNEKFIQKVIHQILAGMEIMRKKNIVHRHLNLENIFINFNNYENEIINEDVPPKINYSNIDLDESFTIKIGNFYYSKNIEQSNESSSIIGEPSYISPEMAEKSLGQDSSNELADNKIDIWSLGIITYELLTGKTPFEGNNSEEIYNKVMIGKYSFPNKLKVSKEIISFIAGLLQYYSYKRLSLEEIKEHPFLKKNIDDFNYIELDEFNKIEIDSKEPDNSLKESLDENCSNKEINELKRNILNLIKENQSNIEEFEKELNEVKSSIQNI